MKAKVLLLLFWAAMAVLIYIAVKHVIEINKTIKATK